MHLPEPESPPDSPTSQIHISPSSTEGSTISEEEDDLAEREWQESLAQLALLFNLVLLPFAGKYFGRKFAYFSTSPFSPLCSYSAGIPLCFLRCT